MTNKLIAGVVLFLLAFSLFGLAQSDINEDAFDNLSAEELAAYLDTGSENYSAEVVDTGLEETFTIDDVENSVVQETNCTGFWGKLKCLLFGSGEKEPLVGKGIWGTRDEALVGMGVGDTITWEGKKKAAELWKAAADERSKWKGHYDNWEKDLSKAGGVDRTIKQMELRPYFTVNPELKDDLKAIKDAPAKDKKKLIKALLKKAREARDKEIANYNKIGGRYETESAKARWAGSWFDWDDKVKAMAPKTIAVLEGVGHALNTLRSFGKHQSFSNLIAPEMSKDWLEITNSDFFGKMDVIGRIEKKWCDYADKHTKEIDGQNYLFIETQSGTYQFVGRIQAEVSENPNFLLCHPVNKTCPGEFVCKDKLCYADEYATTPKKGFLHKIEWGVTAPQDEKQTPFVDENKKAVKFNVVVKFGSKPKYMYSRTGITRREVIQLDNGASDKSMILKYWSDQADRACIQFSSRGYPTDRWGKNPFGDEDAPRELCADFKEISRGTADFTDLEGETVPSYSSTSDNVEQSDFYKP